MATIFNANTTEGLVITPDTSGEVTIQSNGTDVLTITGSGMDLGTGMTLPASKLTGALPAIDGSALTGISAGISDNGTFTTLTVSGGATIKDVTGDYGSIEIDNGATGGWEGYSIGGQSVYMSNGSAHGLYNDVNSQWGIYSVFNGATDIRHAGSAKVTTRSDGATINGNAYFNSGYGSNGIVYGCRKWVLFRGTGTVAVFASGGVSSVTDNYQGVYTINFSGALPNTNYAVTGTAVGNFQSTNGFNGRCGTVAPNLNGTYSTSAVQVLTKDSADINFDSSKVGVAIFR